MPRRTSPTLADYAPASTGTTQRSRSLVPDALLLNLKDAGALLSVSRATMERLVQQGAIPTVKVLGCTRITRHDLEAYVASLSTGFTAAPAALGNQRAKAWSGLTHGAFIPGRDRTAERKGAGAPIPEAGWTPTRKRRAKQA